MDGRQFDSEWVLSGDRIYEVIGKPVHNRIFSLSKQSGGEKQAWEC